MLLHFPDGSASRVFSGSVVIPFRFWSDHLGLCFKPSSPSTAWFCHAHSQGSRPSDPKPARQASAKGMGHNYTGSQPAGTTSSISSLSSDPRHDRLCGGLAVLDPAMLTVDRQSLCPPRLEILPEWLPLPRISRSCGWFPTSALASPCKQWVPLRLDV